jgi:hypothetical protein
MPDWLAKSPLGKQADTPAAAPDVRPPSSEESGAIQALIADRQARATARSSAPPAQSTVTQAVTPPAKATTTTDVQKPEKAAASKPPPPTNKVRDRCKHR